MAAWSFVTLVLGALALGAPLAHALEMPVRRAYDPALYVMVTHTLYFYFATVGAAFEVGAVVAAAILAALIWRDPRALVPARGFVLAGAACLAVAHAIWWLLVMPVNLVTHTARAGLFLLGYCGLLAAVFSDRCLRRVESTG
jgi:hypothetical protein